MARRVFVADRRGAILGQFSAVEDAEQALQMLAMTDPPMAAGCVVLDGDNVIGARTAAWRRDYEDAE